MEKADELGTDDGQHEGATLAVLADGALGGGSYSDGRLIMGRDRIGGGVSRQAAHLRWANR